MKPFISTITFLLLLTGVSAQVQISGKVSERSHLPLPGANIFIQVPGPVHGD
jgi:hypothetical protein